MRRHMRQEELGLNDDFIDLNVPGLLKRNNRPAEWPEVVRAFARTQLDVLRDNNMLRKDAPALQVPIDEAVVRFSDYTPEGQIFVKSGALDRWLSGCDKTNTLSAYQDHARLQKYVDKFRNQRK